MNVEALDLTIKTVLWIFVIAGPILIILSSQRDDKIKFIRILIKSMAYGAFGLWAFPFLSTFLKGPTPGVSVEDNLAFLSSKSPFYSFFIQLPVWALTILIVLLLAILGVILWYRHKHSKLGEMDD